MKLNGRLFKRSPLSTLVELEALEAAVYAKRNLWLSLAALAKRSQIGEPPQLAGLIERATVQLERLQAHHDEAARDALETHAPPRPARAEPTSLPMADRTSQAASDEHLDRVLEDAEGGIDASLLGGPSEAKDSP